ncbi:large ribosomal subunit protein eL30-like [Gorilla gorilla gorilla]|uniref:large ribosomal subunit protein eL30-like n=1 Tax=Gorilla gorilla gorilla TaxID=9595 RepID=UPI0024461B0F|nr:60S ribosomal protein L30-like [Gorilla gorilla gorilla]
MVLAKKIKKSVEWINSRLLLVIKSGKYILGYKQTLKMIRQGKAKLAIHTENCPALRKSKIEYYTMLTKTGVHHYSDNNFELGIACGKYCRVCMLSIIDPDDSDIVRSVPEQTGHHLDHSGFSASPACGPWRAQTDQGLKGSPAISYRCIQADNRSVPPLRCSFQRKGQAAIFDVSQPSSVIPSGTGKTKVTRVWSRPPENRSSPVEEWPDG